MPQKYIGGYFCKCGVGPTQSQGGNYGQITIGVPVISGVLPRCRKESNVFKHPIPEWAEEKPSPPPSLACRSVSPILIIQLAYFPLQMTPKLGQTDSAVLGRHSTLSNSSNLRSNLLSNPSTFPSLSITLL